MIDTQSVPRPGERWLSRPPYVLIAHIVAIDHEVTQPSVITYELQNEEGFPLELVKHAVLDEGWWKAFQPMVVRHG
ncbi:MAG TPA: hypothetical protein VIE64_09655 [Solirubrobacterales bacterium]|jgi:hypothetical protein